jgi:hypothetical protein
MHLRTVSSSAAAVIPAAATAAVYASALAICSAVTGLAAPGTSSRRPPHPRRTGRVLSMAVVVELEVDRRWKQGALAVLELAAYR